TADFSASPTSGAPPLTVEFTNLSTGEYDECIWDFDNDQVKTLCDGPLTAYRSAGNFTVSLTVKGPGGEDSITKTDYITVYAPPTADFSASPTSGPPPLTVEFTNRSTGVYDECTWDFGNGQVKTLCNKPATKYRNEGSFTVTLSVKGPGGEDKKTIEQYIKVGYYRIFLPGVLMTD
ncbi:MAG: PKD domain-containing protein, partial [Candidatus Promineifilaceae bacterium]